MNFPIFVYFTMHTLFGPNLGKIGSPTGGRVPPSRLNRQNITTNLPLHAGSGGRVPPSRSNRRNITTNLPLHAGSGGRVPPSRLNWRNITTNLHVTNALGQLSSVFGFTSRQKFSSLQTCLARRTELFCELTNFLRS